MTKEQLDIQHLEDYVTGIYNSFQIDTEQYNNLVRLINVVKTNQILKENICAD